MNVDLTINLPLVGGVIGFVFAYYKWNLSRRQDRAQYLERLLKEFNSDEIVQMVSKYDSTPELKADTSKIERTLDLVTFLCYLRENGLINEKEFSMFESKLNRVLTNTEISSFLRDTEDYKGELSDKGAYFYVLQYVKTRGLETVVVNTEEDGRAIGDNSPTDIVFEEPTMIIKINRAYKEGMSDYEILEAARKWWRINPDVANKAKLYLAVANGIVKGAFRKKGNWQKDETGLHNGRYCFEGFRAEESVWNQYIGKSVSYLFPKGAANPISYFGMPNTSPRMVSKS